MADAADAAFAHMLERAIQRVLKGDDQVNGLIFTLRSCPSWDVYQRMCGKIEAYEWVLIEMHRIARLMNGEPPDPPSKNIPRMN